MNHMLFPIRSGLKLNVLLSFDVFIILCVLFRVRIAVIKSKKPIFNKNMETKGFQISKSIKTSLKDVLEI